MRPSSSLPTQWPLRCSVYTLWPLARVAAPPRLARRQILNSGASPPATLAACSKEHQSVLVANPSSEVHEGDRILSCKLLSPRRWDMITFHFPEDPSVQYVKRVVGLPGEEIAIRDGAVWIDGKKIVPPNSIRGIEYSPNIESATRTEHGRGDTPIKLEQDEYFVLGDFTDQAYDSRFWQKGAPGHLPYAVPKVECYWRCDQCLLATKSLGEFSLSAACRRFISNSPTPITIPTTASACHFIGKCDSSSIPHCREVSSSW